MAAIPSTINNNNNNIPSDYHTVTICGDLPEVNKDYEINESKDLPPTDYWIDKMDELVDKTSCKVQYISANGPYTSLNESHAIFSAFLFAYNSHEDIVLSPDDIWLMICIYFSQYVNEKAEQLRRLFVDHDNRKQLTVIQIGMMEPDWDDFLERMRVEISKNIKNNVIDMLTSNFSTTNKLESLLSCATIMDTFQKYFEYECYVTKCGIRNVHFMGTLDDWKLLRRKTQELKKFTTSDRNNFETYINAVLPVLDQFIETYQGNIDSEFWNKIMDIEHVGGGRSGRMAGKYVSGWFLRLCYGLHTKSSCEIKQIKLNSLNVPILVNNEITNESKICYVMGGFHGVESSDGRHKPVMSLGIIEDTSTIKPLHQI
ncbi:unnamed protein product [Adineta steineri]|uniref:Uncharacterized protein n=3 Tax=Adineta steineri TaxID=433720 RepID=A0A815A4U4_9BILA|nr:unnamed protein product [Adineta steineri]